MKEGSYWPGEIYFRPVSFDRKSDTSSNYVYDGGMNNSHSRLKKKNSDPRKRFFRAFKSVKIGLKPLFHADLTDALEKWTTPNAKLFPDHVYSKIFHRL